MKQTCLLKDCGKILLTEEEIKVRVKELGEQITKDYQGKEPVMVCILKGASVFFVDLLRSINLPVRMEFMAVSSYGNSTDTSGVVRILKDLDHSVYGKDVIIVEDIVDTGLTLSYIKREMLGRGATSLAIAALLDKPERRKKPLEVDYKGFTIPNEFVVGYGLDYQERYRNMRDIGVLKEELYSKIISNGLRSEKPPFVFG
jgi:hypoxanthine phosphoribosyltransferase